MNPTAHLSLMLGHLANIVPALEHVHDLLLYAQGHQAHQTYLRPPSLVPLAFAFLPCAR